MPTTYPNKELLDTKRAEGVIEPRLLPPGTTLFLETKTQIFELTIREDNLIWTTGVGKRSFSRQAAEFVGSIDQDGTLFAGLIVKNHHLIFKLTDGRYVTGCIQAASVKGKEYSYELWEN